MTVYLIKEKDQLQVHQVRPQEVRFLALYGDKILVVGDSIKEVLATFEELPIIFLQRGLTRCFYYR